MRRIGPLQTVVACLLVVAAGGGARAEEAPPDPAAEAGKAVTFVESLYGEAVRRAKATLAKDDDLALATEVLKQARDEGNTPHLTAALAETAYLLAAPVPEGLETAAAALALRVEALPEHATAAREQRVDLYQAAFSRARGDDRYEVGQQLITACVDAGDAAAEDADYRAASAAYRRAFGTARSLNSPQAEALQRKLRDYSSRVRVQGRAEQMAEQLAKTPENAALRDELVRLYLVELDAPKQAARHVASGDDRVENKLVVLATMTPGRLPEAGALKLADWYRTLADKASPAARPAMLERAVTHYETYLAEHSTDDLDRRKAEMALARVHESLTALAEETAPPPLKAKLAALTREEFLEKYAERFPPGRNVCTEGAASASSQHNENLAENVFVEPRDVPLWIMDTAKGWFEASWSRPVPGRYLLLFTRTTGKTDSWGTSTLSLNGSRPVPLPRLDNRQVLIADLGTVTPIRTLRLEIDGQWYPGLAGLEIHR